MGRGSKLFQRSKVSVVEEIREQDPHSLTGEKKEKKKTLQSVVKSVLKKGAKDCKDQDKLREKKYQVYHSQKEKIAELLGKLKWMESKQEGKERRIEEMESRSLSLEEKLQLMALKNSLKRLEDKILTLNNELTRRRTSINALGIPETSATTYSYDRRPSFEQPQGPSVLRCWGDSSNVTMESSVSLDPEQAAKARKYEVVTVSQKEKVSELKEKLEWMESKHSRKLEKISAMKRESPSFEQKVKLTGVKNSLKRLEKEMSAVSHMISMREDTINKAESLHKQCLTESHSVEEGVTLVDIEL